jgi:hypothetical protein
MRARGLRSEGPSGAASSTSPSGSTG